MTSAKRVFGIAFSSPSSLSARSGPKRLPSHTSSAGSRAGTKRSSLTRLPSTRIPPGASSSTDPDSWLPVR